MPRLFLPNDKFFKGNKKCACTCVPTHWTLFPQNPTISMLRDFSRVSLARKALPTDGGIDPTLTSFSSVIKCLFLGELFPLTYVIVIPLLQHPQFY